VATLLVLQARGRVTVAEVAAQLEVSERTARRDMEALALAGIPVYSQRGRGGGWSLLGGARTDLTGLTQAEARALFLVAGPSSSATPELRAALRKLVRALPESFRAEAEAAAGAVVIDPTAWGRHPSDDPPYLALLQRAVVEGRQVRLGYIGRDRRTSERVVHPLGLVTKGTVWYLVANTIAGQRTFRVWRVQSVEVLADPVRRPPGFDLAAAWRAITDSIDERRAAVRAIALVDADVLHPLCQLLGNRVTVDAPADSGRTRVVVTGSTPHLVAADLASFGGAVEVIAPPEVRDALARLGRELIGRYDSP